MSVWIKFLGKNAYGVGKLRTKLKLSNCKVVIDDRLNTLAEVIDDHQKWAEVLAHEYNHTCTQVYAPAKLLPLPCGLYATSQEVRRGHMSKCKSCLGTLPKRSEVKPGEAISVFKIPGLTEFNLAGLSLILQERRDKLLEIAEGYDSAAKAIDGLPDLDRRSQELEDERGEHEKALKFFLQEERHLEVS